MNRPSKRQRRENPKTWLHNHSLAFVAAPIGEEPIRTPVASLHDKEVFLDRLQKEIIEPLHLFRGKRPRTLKDHAPATQEDRKVTESKGPRWPKHVVIGTNQCTRALENATKGDNAMGKPSLVVLARDIYPPLMLSHVPVMVQQINKESDGGQDKLPILLLPGRASKELGAAFGPKNVSIIVFLEEDADSVESDDCKESLERICSFVKFVKRNLLPK